MASFGVFGRSFLHSRIDASGFFSFALDYLGPGGKSEKALEEIERACHEPVDPDVINLKIEPLLDPLRGDRRFERLVAKVLGTPEKKSP